ncbi:MAG: type II toxin-antitoxin system Phd/YefM family antitoxin [Oscillospiraceae bacterium]
MYNTNISKARANLYNLVDMAIEDSEVININTKRGNAIILGEADYNALIETLYLSSNPALKQSIIDGINAPLGECVDESEVDL